MPLAPVAGLPTYSCRTGEGVRRALFIHCSLAHSGAWKGVCELLSPKLSMTLFDRPGHGQSGGWHGHGDLHARTTRIAAALIGPRADLIGHSYGATVALRLALEHPGRVRSLTLIEPVIFAAARGSPEFGAHGAMMAQFAAALAAGEREGAARMFQALWSPEQAFDSLPETVRVRLTERIGLIGDEAGVTMEDAAGLLAPGGLEALEMPVQLIEGSLSPPIVGAVHAGLAARIPGARRVVVAGAGHMLPITHPAAVAGEIAAFLKL